MQQTKLCKNSPSQQILQLPTVICVIHCFTLGMLTWEVNEWPSCFFFLVISFFQHLHRPQMVQEVSCYCPLSLNTTSIFQKWTLLKNYWKDTCNLFDFLGPWRNNSSLKNQILNFEKYVFLVVVDKQNVPIKGQYMYTVYILYTKNTRLKINKNFWKLKDKFTDLDLTCNGYKSMNDCSLCGVD